MPGSATMVYGRRSSVLTAEAASKRGDYRGVSIGKAISASSTMDMATLSGAAVWRDLHSASIRRIAATAGVAAKQLCRAYAAGRFHRSGNLFRAIAGLRSRCVGRSKSAADGFNRPDSLPGQQPQLVSSRGDDGDGQDIRPRILGGVHGRCVHRSERAMSVRSICDGPLAAMANRLVSLFRTISVASVSVSFHHEGILEDVFGCPIGSRYRRVHLHERSGSTISLLRRVFVLAEDRSQQCRPET